MPTAQPAPTRPRTRAWTRAQAEKNRQLNTSTDLQKTENTPIEKSKGQSKVQRKTAAVRPSGPTAAVSNAKPTKAQPKKSQRKPSKVQQGERSPVKDTKPTRKHRRGQAVTANVAPVQTTKRQGLRNRVPDIDNHRQQEQKKTQPSISSTTDSQTQNVSTWLQQVPPGSERQAADDIPWNPPVLNAYSGEEDMPSNSTSQRIASTNQSTEKAPSNRTREENKVTVDKLNNRCILEESGPQDQDERWLAGHEYLKDACIPEVERTYIKKFKRVALKLVQEFDQDRPDKFAQALSDLRFELDKATAESQHPLVLQQYFDSMRKKCLNDNEAVLQRTMMMNIFHQYWISENFDWNTESVWSICESNRIRSAKDDKLSRPKQDLAISFKWSTFQEHTSRVRFLPPDLIASIKPDGGPRCFPFLIMEVKKSQAELANALLHNLHSASQALYNIYLWMSRADMSSSFFDNVRVFTFVLNAKDLGVRVHRARLSTDKTLVYTFRELFETDTYSRERVCAIINCILREYALKDLQPLLIKAFKALTEGKSVKSSNASDKTPTNGEEHDGGESEALGTRKAVDETGKRRANAMGPPRKKRTRPSPAAAQGHTGVSQNFEDAIISDLGD